jgi:succinate dehydrogenase / fumarate reductase iron-sulfur subunit
MAGKGKKLTVHLKVWRQKNNKDKGRFVDYTLNNVSTSMSFLEMLDVLNEDLVSKGEDSSFF